jgi:hypothetical protein
MKKQPFAIPLKIRLRAPSATHYRHLAGLLWLDLGREEKGSRAGLFGGVPDGDGVVHKNA